MSLLLGGEVARSSGFGRDVDASRAAAVLDTVRHMLGIPLVEHLDDASRDVVTAAEPGR
jgi:hypothetical protein